MICITTQGTAYERGLQQGVQTAPLIRQIHGRYAAKGLLGADPMPTMRRLGRLFPELVAEMEGIAAGSGICVDQVLRMNLMPLGAGPACSVAGVRDADGKAWIAKTDDIAAEELGSNILRRDIPATGTAALHLHFAGTIWTSAACAANGFCMAMTGMPGAHGPDDGVPPQVLWRVLPDRCGTVSDAVAFLRGFTISAGGMSLLLADAHQALVLVEKTTQGQSVREMTDPAAALCHTNHACLGGLRDRPAFLDTALGQSSAARLRKLHDLLGRRPHSREGLKRLCADHTSPGAICQHGGGGLHTDYAVLLSPLAGGAWVTMGPACRAPFAFVEVR